MEMNIIEKDDKIQELKEKFLANGLPWDEHITKAINQATSGIKDPQLQSVVNSVALVLEKELEKCIINASATLLQKLWAKVRSWFSKK